ncbi:MAG TPA: hypothetical protein PLC38_07915 [Methanobacterium sp.]|jgi:hypothetical protein|nr:MAG: hypothetical protein FGO69_11100 [Methanobacterium sp.]HOI72195.1 hypothetical protein [Methanobacterium sp.]
MNLGKSLMILVLLFSILGVFTFVNSMAVVSAQNESPGGTDSPGGQTWIAYNASNVRMTALTATITLTIKNNKDYVQYFKISHLYTGSLQENQTIKFIVDWTDPVAERMIDPVSPELGGDYGWAIQAGETKTVKFKVSATGLMGNEPSWIADAGAVDNTFWPIIPDMGLQASWFMPNEIEMLNPNLDLKSWCGTFTFTATNFASYPVAGLIRGPIIPTDSALTSSDPQAFVDNDIAFNTNVAAWDVHIDPQESQGFTYTYKWPIVANGTPTGNGQCFVPATAANNTTTVPTQETGSPYGLLVLAVLIVAAGLGYAKFLR